MAGSNSNIDRHELKTFLDQKADYYNSTSFISTDPIQVPHLFKDPCDIEIAAFLTATIAWGQKITIISNAQRLLSMMGDEPCVFLRDAGEEDMKIFLPFVHRTFNGMDCIYFIRALQRIVLEYGGLRTLFEASFTRHGEMRQVISDFREAFFTIGEPGHAAKHLADPSRGASGKHLPDPLKGSAAKRINMFLRWMVRRDRKGVDFGLWEGIPMKALYIPLDIHSGTVARKLGLLRRKQNDWRAVEELTGVLREFDQEDPVRYDFALFGLGSFEKF